MIGVSSKFALSGRYGIMYIDKMKGMSNFNSRMPRIDYPLSLLSLTSGEKTGNPIILQDGVMQYGPLQGCLPAHTG